MSSNICFAKGLGVGFIVGSAVGVCMMPRKKNGKRNTFGRVLRTVGDVLENMSEAVGM